MRWFWRRPKRTPLWLRTILWIQILPAIGKISLRLVIYGTVPNSAGIVHTVLENAFAYINFFLNISMSTDYSSGWIVLRNNHWAMLRIHDILVWIRIRIRGSMPLTYGSGSWIGFLLFSSLTFCADQPYILSWPMVISSDVNGLFVAV